MEPDSWGVQDVIGKQRSRARDLHVQRFWADKVLSPGAREIESVDISLMAEIFPLICELLKSCTVAKKEGVWEEGK